MTDDADDDEALRPMRAVWLQMREADEEPPSGGMAALLVAAREKADQLREVHERPSLRQRVLATLKRLWAPQAVLALASVVVLVSGAIVLGNRHDEMSAPAHESTAGAQDRSRDDSFAAPSPAGSPLVGQAQTSESSAGSSAGSSVISETEDEAARVSRPTTEPSKPTVASPKKKQPTKGAVKDPAVVPIEANQAESAPGGGQPPAVDSTKAAGEDGPATGTVAPKAPTTQTTETKPTAPTTKPKPQDARGPTAAQLAKQSESAAARGDCPAVKLNVQRLVKLDRVVHDALVARNASVARCLK